MELNISRSMCSVWKTAAISDDVAENGLQPIGFDERVFGKFICLCANIVWTKGSGSKIVRSLSPSLIFVHDIEQNSNVVNWSEFSKTLSE
jgi:hypothetical protein